ncbi:MAG TPA: sigma 54-interacting transcriptional regulator [Anaerolineales bacterium]|nr:sigma 54-interacting transcriptional regulator [Anaerolineales bacterium]
MQPNLPWSLDELHAAHDHFVRTGRLPRLLDPLVIASWQRCSPRLNPFAPPRWTSLNAEVFRLNLNQHKDLIRQAQPLLEDLQQTLEGTGAALLLVDSTNCVLLVVGESQALAPAGLRPGVFLDESHIGTNAFGITQLQACPACVVGGEHFLTVWHEIATAAAPIFGLDGHAEGAIGVIGKAGSSAGQMLSLVVATAKSIENQLTADQLLLETHLQSTELNATIDAISEGVLAWNATTGRVTHLNRQAGQMLGVMPSELLGRALADFVTLPEGVARALSRGQELSDVLVNLNVAGESRECLLSLRIVHGPAQQPATYIATLRQAETVRQLVTQMVGAQAHLTIDDLGGDGPAAQRVRRQALAIADAKASVLLLGESGTGKNILARAIHNSSRRAARPFLAINCRAVPRELALQEFLGYEAGVFGTSGVGDQPSKFELADGGTLFLEEVDALPLDMQAALLRVIEAGDVIRLGGKRVWPVDTRIIASSHHDLEAMVDDGGFRRDLFFRLSAVIITIPPLRDRPEDIGPLIDRVLTRLRTQLGRPLIITSAARATLLAYPWPGNVRELQSLLERLALTVEAPEIDQTHLPQSVRQPRGPVAPPPGIAAADEPVVALDEVERRAIRHALTATGHNASQAAKLLGIGRSTLWRKMKAFGLDV